MWGAAKTTKQQHQGQRPTLVNQLNSQCQT